MNLNVCVCVWLCVPKRRRERERVCWVFVFFFLSFFFFSFVQGVATSPGPDLASASVQLGRSHRGEALPGNPVLKPLRSPLIELDFIDSPDRPLNVLYAHKAFVKA